MALNITDTGTELQNPVNAVFEQTFLRRAQQVCPYFTGTQAGQMNTQQGSNVIKWRRIEQATPSTSALSELTSTASYGMGRSSDVPSFTDVTATMAKYGQFYIVNEEVDLYNPNGTTNELVAVLGESAGRSLNQLMRDIEEDNSTQRFASNVASTGAVHAIISTGDLKRVINELTKNSARTFSAMGTGSTLIGTTPILPSYWAICHPDMASDIAGLTGFTSVEKYAGFTSTLMGEFGYYGGAGRGVRFVISEDATKDAAAGAALSGADLNSAGGTKVDVCTLVVYGDGAFGSVGLGKRQADGTYMAGENTGAFQLINHERGSSGTADPFNEIATLAWKAFFAGAVLNANWSRAIRAGTTNLTN